MRINLSFASPSQTCDVCICPTAKMGCTQLFIMHGCIFLSAVALLSFGSCSFANLHINTYTRCLGTKFKDTLLILLAIDLIKKETELLNKYINSSVDFKYAYHHHSFHWKLNWEYQMNDLRCEVRGIFKLTGQQNFAQMFGQESQILQSFVQGKDRKNQNTKLSNCWIYQQIHKLSQLHSNIHKDYLSWRHIL